MGGKNQSKVWFQWNVDCAVKALYIGLLFTAIFCSAFVVKFLEVLRPFISVLPEVAKPERRVS
jgi:hypothetical protein